MPRNEFGRYPAARKNRLDLTRRGLLGAAAVITGAGVADLLHRGGSKGTPRASAASKTGLNTHVSDGSEPPVSSGSHRPSTHSSVPAHHGSGDAPPPHAHTDSTKPRHHVEVHGHESGDAAHAHVVDQVVLPPAKVRVRTRPVYYVDQLVHDAPPHAIALTVDDGPDPLYTPKVLRLLDKYRMQASFCIVGAHAEAYPKLIRDIHRAGHVIVNHTFTHVQPFNRQTQRRIVNEITRTQRAIEQATKVTPRLFRAPGGAWSPFIFRAIASYELIPLDWDIDPMDWAMPGTRRIEHRMLQGRPNDIVLCHDGGGNRSETVRALRKVLPEWKHRGYVTIPLVVPAEALVPPARSMPPPSDLPSPSSGPSESPTSSATP
ncbi:MAG TPA: polysaccharide deacetylase family protein [Mycobacteriales bacterium]|nr:polysaccharide deacetylase family protein [Mycobacteriales bacterium]